MKHIGDIYGMTATALFRISDGGIKGPNHPYIEYMKGLVAGYGVFDISGLREGGAFAGITGTGLVLYDDHSGERRPPGELKAVHWRTLTPPLRGLFLKREDAILAFAEMTVNGVRDRDLADGRFDGQWIGETAATVTAIGLEHPTYIISPEMEPFINAL